MKRELELKDIAGYLPYELRALNKCKNSQTFGTFVHAGLGSINYYISHPDKFNIILRPLSDLYEPITHNGKEIIPILELAKMVEGNINWRIGNFSNGSKYLYGENKQFSFNKGEFSYRKETKLLDYPYMIDFSVNQYQLFDFLHELKIDYRGLIDDGLAISVYDLDTNPYK